MGRKPKYDDYSFIFLIVYVMKLMDCQNKWSEFNIIVKDSFGFYSVLVNFLQMTNYKW